jgi:3-hydroxyacyl-[acyl-carrier-protein] dehydratase
MKYQYIFDLLPYRSSFRFVDEISFLDPGKVIGHYTLKKDAFFYEDHFVGYPVTPGAILTEIMAQIGLVVLGIYLIAPAPHEAVDDNSSTAAGNPGSAAGNPATQDGASADGPLVPLFTSIEVSFHKMALPGQKVTVISRKDYFRFDKLKCHVEMQDASGELIAKGVFAGMIKRIVK